MPRDTMPSKADIKNYWYPLLVVFGKFDCKEEVYEADYCFACGMTYKDGNNTDRAHILAHWRGGNEDVSNLHLLCSGCHAQSENYIVDDYWIWFMETNPYHGMARHMAANILKAHSKVVKKKGKNKAVVSLLGEQLASEYIVSIQENPSLMNILNCEKYMP